MAFVAVADPLARAAALAGAQAQALSEVTLRTVVVTGSTIKRTFKETRSPLQVISDEDLESSGYTNASEVAPRTIT
jgi:hypothetical protein